MIRDDLVDVITIAVKVPAHRELVLAALDAVNREYLIITYRTDPQALRGGFGTVGSLLNCAQCRMQQM